MPLKLEELLQLKNHHLHEELGEMSRPQLQALAKKCGLKANQRTLELTGCLAEYIIKEKRAKGVPAGTPYSTHKTPHNPIYNPRYAPTDTKKALATRGSDAAPSTGKATGGGKEWHLTKSKELAELEAALKTMPPPPQAPRTGRAIATPSLPSSSKAVAAATASVTGKKRKYDDSAVTPAEHPPAKRQPSTTPYANTLELRRAILRRPGQPKPVPGPSRLGQTSSTPSTANENKNQANSNNQIRAPSTMKSTKKVKFSPTAPADTKKTESMPSGQNRGQNSTPFNSRNVADTSTPNGFVARRPIMRAVSSAKSRMSSGSAKNKTASGGIGGKSSSSSLRVAAAIRATKAHESYIARMRKAQKT